MERTTAGASARPNTADQRDRELDARAQSHMDAANDDSLVPDDKPDFRRDAVREVASARNPEKVPQDAQVDALEWFLSEDEGDFTKKLRLNVGGPVDDDGKTPLNLEHPPKWIEWVVRPLDLDTIRRVRRTSVQANNRRQRRAGGGEFDETLFNLGVVVEATIYPNLREAAGKLQLADPRKALELRFQNKSGLIGQIVGEVLDLSGYNEDDVQEAGADGVQAAGN